MKFILTYIAALCGFMSISVVTSGQSFISLSSGISRDINNTKPFYHIPVSLQWKPFPKSSNPFLIEVDYDIPFKNNSLVNAYTSNPSLPQQVSLQENIRSYLFTVSAGLRIYLFSIDANNKFYFDFLLGFCNQKFKVDYVNYDNANYEVLNPDVDSNNSGFVLSTSVVYNLNHDFQIMLHAQTPLLIDREKYPVSYKFAAPLQLTFGYNFYYNKSK